MEVIGGVGTFLAIADVLQKLYKKLKDYVKALTVAAAEARKLAKDISNFAGLLLLVEDVLAKSQMVIQRSPKFLQVEKSQIAGAKDLIDKLTRLNKGFPPLMASGQGNIIKKWLMNHKWIAIKQDIQVLQFSVESAKGSMNVLLHTVTLDGLTESLKRSTSTNGAGQQVAVLEAKM